ncbi:diguanylate cyclase (GGDEF) domain-containing protein [Pseudoxanthomonas sp. GM95]|uniref:GGDEF domain-containing protein n=1 Tax=Pseudoxanthomonas sp. GM95 TaxID=1881043 RepID=UPI0008C27047|nr:GGDEF domain-containing protein [Pseudoxanthomonas sp. GM95]SEL53379.1 diguanylate cyclase (GGDEF) domain-containing protein [Pseudoxanthomonas sp. GM95]
MPLALPLLYLLGHMLAIVLAPGRAEVLSFLFLIGAPLLAAGTCLWRCRGNGAAPAWIALAVGLLLWAGGMAVNMVQTVLLDSADATAGASILLYVLYGVPLTFALASPERERWQVRVVDAVLALVLGYLFFVHTFSFATMSTASQNDLGKLVLMLDIENSFIALFSLVRWLASRTASRRGFYRCQTVFAWTYLAVAAYINHAEPADAGFGGMTDLLIDLPFLLLAALALRAPTTAPPARVSPRLSLVVQAGSPLLLPMSLLVMSALISGTHLHLAIAGFVIATLGYGVRSVITQLRAMAERDQLDALARVDKLTGLANRREFDDALQREWNRARRSGEPLSLLMVDIDHFKRLNDSFGHQIGDVRLREVAQALAGGTARALDLVARYGGEEFAVILPATNAIAAQPLAEQMRAAVQALMLPAPEGEVTVSIGVSSAEHVVSDDPATLLAATDAALYDAKRAGRNRVAYRALGER